MKIQLSEIMNASISELDDLDMELSFEVESINRQLSSNYNNGDWRKKAMLARDHMQRAQALVRTRLDKLYYGEERFLHGAILKMIRKDMSIDRFMGYVNKAKIASGTRKK